MRKAFEIDFSLADECRDQIRSGGLTQPNLDELREIYAEDIASEYGKMYGGIRAVDSDSAPSSARIICHFFDNNEPKDFFSTCSAMLEIFKDFGVFNAYCEPWRFPGRAYLIGAPHKTRLLLKRPDGIGTFVLDYEPHPQMQNQPLEGRNKQVLRYRKGWNESWRGENIN